MQIQLTKCGDYLRIVGQNDIWQARFESPCLIFNTLGGDVLRTERRSLDLAEAQAQYIIVRHLVFTAFPFELL